MNQNNGLDEFVIQLAEGKVLEPVVEVVIEEGDYNGRTEEDLQGLFDDEVEASPHFLAVTPTRTVASKKAFSSEEAWLNPPSFECLGSIISPPTRISLQASKIQVKTREDSGRPVECKECNEYFFSKEKLTVHLISNHGKQHCGFCAEMFSTGVEREEHEKLEHSPFECDICLEAVDNLDTHYERAHDMRNCLYCGVLVKPKSYYKVHVRRKHFVNGVDALEERDVRLVSRSDAWNFSCHLCGKERKRADIFGHFISYHRLSLMCLVVFLRTEQTAFNVQGAVAPSTPVSSSCTVCTKQFTYQVPKPVHDVYCQSLRPCLHCDKTFTSPDAREAHIELDHPNACSRGCESAIVSEADLETHHKDEHSEIACRYCQTLLSDDPARLVDHLTSKHAVASRSKALQDHGVDVFRYSPKSSCFCCVLCNANTVLHMDDLSSLVKHLDHHSLSLSATLKVLESYRLYEKKREPERDERETVIKSGPEVRCADSESSSSDEYSSEEEELEDKEERRDDAEMDPTEVECVVNDTSDDEEEDEEEDEGESFLQESKTDEGLDKKSLANKTMEIIERTMEDIFQESQPRPVLLDWRPDIEVQINEEEGSDSKENATNNHAQRRRTKQNGMKLSRPKTNVERQVKMMKQEHEAVEQALNSTLGCELCIGKEYLMTPSGYVKHMKLYHRFSVSRHSKVTEVSEDGDEQEQVYQCPFCAIRSAWKHAIRQHLFKMHPEDCALDSPGDKLAYKCRYCADKFWRATKRNQHQIAVHDDQILEFYKCYVCSQISSSKLLLTRHMKNAHPGDIQYASVSYKCKLCLLTYPSLCLLRDHFTTMHPTSLVFPCRLCNVTFKNQKTLLTHIKNMHMDVEDRRRDCNLCGKTLYSKRAHAIHYRMKHAQASKVGFRCRICQQRFDSKDDRKMHYTVDHLGESPYHCSECGKGFASKSGMYGHKQLHTGTGISKCQYCGKEFTRKDSYNEHLLIHNGPRHKCPHCVKEFVQRSNLVRHIRIHTGEKPYKCLYCDKCFSDKGACNSHIRVHTREETCSCPYCGQTFSKKQKLKYHIRKHTGEGLINCEVCSKAFTNNFELKQHRLIHNRETSILCGTCGKGFNNEKYLQRHIAIVHEPQHSFVCPLCSKVFSQQTRLKSHIMTHTGIQHMKCLLCDKAYSVRKSLRRHLLEKHQVAPDHPQYKHCFYAMTYQEAGLTIPGVAPEGIEEPSEEPAVSEDLDKPSTSRQKAKKRPKKEEETPEGSTTHSSEASSSEESVPKRKGISNIVDRLQKRLTTVKGDDSSDEEPVIARMTALNGDKKTAAVGRRNLGRKPVPERIPRRRASEETEEDSS